MTGLISLAAQVDAAYEREAMASRLLADLMIETDTKGEDLGRYRAEVNEAVESYRKAKAYRNELADQFQEQVEGGKK